MRDKEKACVYLVNEVISFQYIQQQGPKDPWFQKPGEQFD